MTAEETQLLAKIQSIFESREEREKKLHGDLMVANAKITDMQTGLRTAQQQAADLKQKCETMAAHPDVIKAASEKAEANLRAAQEQVDRLKKTKEARS